MKTFLKIAGPTLMLLGLLLVARLPLRGMGAERGAGTDPPAVLLVSSGPLWRGGLALMAAGGGCLILQAFLKK